MFTKNLLTLLFVQNIWSNMEYNIYYYLKLKRFLYSKFPSHNIILLIPNFPLRDDHFLAKSQFRTSYPKTSNFFMKFYENHFLWRSEWNKFQEVEVRILKHFHLYLFPSFCLRKSSWPSKLNFFFFFCIK